MCIASRSFRKKWDKHEERAEKVYMKPTEKPWEDIDSMRGYMVERESENKDKDRQEQNFTCAPMWVLKE